MKLPAAFLALAGLCLSAHASDLPTCKAAVESCSAAMPDAPDAAAIDKVDNTDADTFAARRGAYLLGQAVPVSNREVSTRPFSAVGIAVKVGIEGVGFDVATPLSTRTNLRAGASFFSYNPAFSIDSIDTNGAIQLRKVSTLLDFFPFGGSFRLSAGATLYNGNHLSASALVPGGQTFTLNDTDYVSSAQDPVHGAFDVRFGNKVAPVFTLGFGNLVPRRAGKRFTVPFEFGFEYIAQPTIALTLAGTACDPTQPPVVGCQSIATDPMTQANIAAEQKTLNSDISPLRFFPILSIGFGYKF